LPLPFLVLVAIEAPILAEIRFHVFNPKFQLVKTRKGMKSRG
jgi:hypothetical protein